MSGGIELDEYEEKYFDEKFKSLHVKTDTVNDRVTAVYIQLGDMKEADKVQSEKMDAMADGISDLKSQCIAHEMRLNGHDNAIEALQDAQPVPLDKEDVTEKDNRWRNYGILITTVIVGICTWMGAGTPGV